MYTALFRWVNTHIDDVSPLKAMAFQALRNYVCFTDATYKPRVGKDYASPEQMEQRLLGCSMVVRDMGLGKDATVIDYLFAVAHQRQKEGSEELNL